MILSMTNLKSFTKNIVVLGASGWIGKNFVSSLSKLQNVNLFLYSSKKPKTIEIKKDLTYKTIPIEHINNLDIDKVDSLIDLAFPTQDKIEELGNDSYLEQVNNLLVLKKEFLNQFQPLNIFNISSGAVHWKNNKSNLYSKKKIEEEKMYIYHCENSNASLDIARVFGFLGSFYDYKKHYAFTSFIQQAKENNEIIIESSKHVYRSYILFDNLFSYYKHRTFEFVGNDVNIFDACLDTFEIGYLANLIAKKFSSKVIREKKIQGVDEYIGDNKYLLNYLKTNKLDWQITDKKILNLIQ